VRLFLGRHARVCVCVYECAKERKRERKRERERERAKGFSLDISQFFSSICWSCLNNHMTDTSSTTKCDLSFNYNPRKKKGKNKFPSKLWFEKYIVKCCNM
jgi:hypothetical protein